jgi:hypothetical protein
MDQDHCTRKVHSGGFPWGWEVYAPEIVNYIGSTRLTAIFGPKPYESDLDNGIFLRVGRIA